jgi:hypothetical protein
MGTIDGTVTWAVALQSHIDMENIGMQNTSDSIVKNNYIHGGYAIGIYFYADPYGVQSNNIVTGNFIVNNGRRGYILYGYNAPSTTSDNNILAYNVFSGCSSPADVSNNTSTLITEGNSTTQRNYIVNNIFYDGAGAYEVYFYKDPVFRMTIENNIFYSSDSYIYLSNDDPSANLVIDHNLYNSTGPNKFGKGSYDTWSQWKSYGYDAHSLAPGNPNFVNGSGTYSTATDFALQSDSPAIDAGILISGLTSDYSGNPIINNPDIGAFENSHSNFYYLTVNSGTGSGSYAQGATVSITANPPASGKTFDAWTGDTQYLSDPVSATTTVTMPNKPIALTATYKNLPSGGGSSSGGGGGSVSISPSILKTEIKSITGNNLILNLSVTNAASMMLSDNAIFTGADWVAYAAAPAYIKKDDQSTLYLKFKSTTGITSQTVTLSIPTNTNNNTNNNSNTNTTTPPSLYSTGTLLKLSTSPRVYVVIQNKKKWISTPEVFTQLGYQWTSIQTISDTTLKQYPDYEDNLIRQRNDYKVYLVVNGVKRHIPNPPIFLDYGFLWTDVVDTDQSVIDKYKDTYLIKESGKEGIYYINQQGVRKLIPNTDIFNSYGDKIQDVQIVSKLEMESYPVSNLIRLNNSNDVYLIQGNIKKHVPSVKIATKYKLNLNQVMSVNQQEFNFYQSGGELK